ncbi:MAG: PEP-CTERM sorting domain-containing protein [Kiritimatiellia bacterium]
MQTNNTLKLIAAMALFSSLPFAAHAQRIWDGETDGDWQEATNWDGNTTIPSSGNALQFGAATTYAVINSPSTNFGTLRFLSTAGANYSLSGNTTNNEIYGTVTVEGSASATNHTINNRFRLNNKTFDIQSTSTSLTLNNFDYGGSSRTLTKNGDGTLILTNNATNPGELKLNGGTVDYQNNVGTGNGRLHINGSNSSAVVTNSTGTSRTLHFGYQDGTVSASFAGSITGNLNVNNGRTSVSASGINQTFTGTSASTYTGTTGLNAGTWTLNGTHTGGDNYTISGGTDNSGTLAGSGSIVLADNTKTFSFTGASGQLAALNPGESGTDTSTLTLGSGSIDTVVNLNDFSELRVDIGGGTASDRLDIFGDLNLDPGSSLNLLSLGGAWDGSTYTVATFSNLSGTFGTVNGLDSGYQVNYGSNDITLSVIPEPSTLVLIGIALASLGLLRRRKR